MSARHVISGAIFVSPDPPDIPAMTDAILSALHAAGFAVVPVEPTEAMLDAGEEDEQGWRRMPYPRVRLKLHWEAMIAAAKETGDEG
jgi:hypothetical protein